MSKNANKSAPGANNNGRVASSRAENKVRCGRQYVQSGKGTPSHKVELSTKNKRALKITAIVALCVIAVVVGVVYVMQNKQLIGIAATVNGVDIPESEVTSQIESFRSANGLTTETAWGQYLAQYGNTPEKIRYSLIESNFVTNILYDAEYTKRGITVDQDYVDKTLETFKETYATDEAMENALSEQGYTYNSYVEELKSYSKQLALGKQLMEEQNDDVTSDEQTYAQYYNEDGNGSKKITYIAFPTSNEDMANEFLEKAKGGQDFDQLIDEYKGKDTGSDETEIATQSDVWTMSLTTLSDDTISALKNLSVGSISDKISDESASLIYIAKCTDEYTSPESFTSIDQLKSEWVEEIKEYVSQSHAYKLASEWKSNALKSADFTVYPMPTTLSYWISDEDMKKYNDQVSSSSSSSSSSDSSETDGESSTDSEVSVDDITSALESAETNTSENSSGTGNNSTTTQ